MKTITSYLHGQAGEGFTRWGCRCRYKYKNEQKCCHSGCHILFYKCPTNVWRTFLISDRWSWRSRGERSGERLNGMYAFNACLLLLSSMECIGRSLRMAAQAHRHSTEHRGGWGLEYDWLTYLCRILSDAWQQIPSAVRSPPHPPSSAILGHHVWEAVDEYQISTCQA
jgi:hypothetical protein